MGTTVDPKELPSWLQRVSKLLSHKLSTSLRKMRESPFFVTRLGAHSTSTQCFAAKQSQSANYGGPETSVDHWFVSKKCFFFLQLTWAVAVSLRYTYAYSWFYSLWLLLQIDTEGEGCIQEDEFCSYLLQQLREKDSLSHFHLLPFQDSPRFRHNMSSKETLCRLIFTGSQSYCVSVSKVRHWYSTTCMIYTLNDDIWVI